MATLHNTNESHAHNAKSSFIANISHDLRTPLHTMLGIAELLHIKQHYPEQEELIEGIIQSGKSLLQLVEQMLQLSDLESAPENLLLENLDLHQLTQDLLADYLPDAKKKNLELSLTYGQTVPHQIKSSRQSLKRILGGLLSNAIKFTTTGHVRMVVEPIDIQNDRATLQILVKDTGIGIRREELPHVFEHFYRAAPSYTGKHKGSGLGLAIAKKLTERLGGTLSVNSTEAVGSVFRCTFTFPLTHPRLDPLAQASLEHKTLAPIGSTLKVLLVEDEPLIQKFTRAMLMELGCTVKLAKNGQEALEQLQNPFDLIFMDIGLPDISGLSVTEHLRTEKNPNQKTPVVALTAHVSAEDKTRCFQAGIDHFLTKPASYVDFRALIEKCQPLQV